VTRQSSHSPLNRAASGLSCGLPPGRAAAFIFLQRSAAIMQQPIEQIELTLQALQARYLDLKRDRRFQSIIIFKNHGEGAGTSIRHPHWQIIATPVVPQLLSLKRYQATEYFNRTGNCLYRVMLEEEVTAKQRLIAGNDDFVAFVPYAASLPFETWIFRAQCRPRGRA
jgi:UDPglucose--hexose-1-phosphate uridylyltransferase